MKKVLLVLISLIFFSFVVKSQNTQWNLDSCINYALRNNIQIKQSEIGLEEAKVNRELAQKQLFPNLSASIGQNLSTQPFLVSGGSLNTYSGSYGVSSSLTLFNGGKLTKTVRQQKLQEQVSENNLAQSQIDIQMSILESYLQILYAAEALKINKSTLEVSEYQMERAKSLLALGSISKVDLVQLEAQYSSDKYQITVTENTLRNNILSLKQLLELDLNDSISIITPELADETVLTPLSSLSAVYEDALNSMPGLKNSKLNVDIAEIEIQKAQANYMPTASLNASAGTGHNNQSTYTFAEQMQNGFNAGIGVSVSIPIFTKGENKAALSKAKLSEKTAELQLIDDQKALLREVQQIYQDALAAQSQYVAASENMKSLKESYELIQQQYNLGMKNTLELLTEKNNLLIAQQNLIQAKYISIMNSQLLNLYRNLPMTLE